MCGKKFHGWKLKFGGHERDYISMDALRPSNMEDLHRIKSLHTKFFSDGSSVSWKRLCLGIGLVIIIPQNLLHDI